MAFAISISSCKDDNVAMQFESYDLSVTADGADSDSLRNIIADFDGRWDVHTSGLLPTRLGDKDLSELRDSLMKMSALQLDGKKLAIRLPEEMIPLNDKSKDSGETIPAKGATPGSKYGATLSLDLLTQNVAVFHSAIYSYPEGAAHGAFANKYLNYDIATGKIVTMQSLFANGYDKFLLQSIRERLEESGVELLIEPEELRLPSQFRITANGLEFVYGLYEIAPYSEGEPRVEFAPGELSPILSPTGKAILLTSPEE